MKLKILPGRPVDAVLPEPSHIQFFEDGIPGFVEAALESLYECHMTTILRFGQYYPLHCARAYVCRVDGKISAVIVFRQEGRSVMVYNEQISIPPAELRRFAQAVFARYPQTCHIALYAIDAGAEILPYPYQRLSCLEDISLALPESVSRYTDLLGKNVRYHLRRMSKKLGASFPGVSREFRAGAEVEEGTIHRIIEFSGMRIGAKGQRSYHTAEEVRKTIEQVRRYGIVYLVTIDGALCAGVVMLRIGRTYSLHILAHDPHYDRYSLGTLCCYEAIAYAISQGARRFNFGWGRFEYKQRLAGRTTDLFSIDVYRSTAALLGDMPAICRRAWRTGRRHLKMWSARPAEEGGVLSRQFRRAWGTARQLRARLST